MTDQVFFGSKLERVYFYRGRFRDNQGKSKFIKAPFDKIWIEGQPYFMPVSSPAGGGASGINSVAQFDEGQDFELSRHFAYDTLENIIIGEHEMGDWNSNKDNWLQVQQFRKI